MTPTQIAETSRENREWAWERDAVCQECGHRPYDVPDCDCCQAAEAAFRPGGSVRPEKPAPHYPSSAELLELRMSYARQLDPQRIGNPMHQAAAYPNGARGAWPWELNIGMGFRTRFWSYPFASRSAHARQGASWLRSRAYAPTPQEQHRAHDCCDGDFMVTVRWNGQDGEAGCACDECPSIPGVTRDPDTFELVPA